MPESVEIPAPVSTATRHPANSATSSGDSAQRAVTYSRVRGLARAVCRRGEFWSATTLSVSIAISKREGPPAGDVVVFSRQPSQPVTFGKELDAVTTPGALEVGGN